MVAKKLRLAGVFLCSNVGSVGVRRAKQVVDFDGKEEVGLNEATEDKQAADRSVLIPQPRQYRLAIIVALIIHVVFCRRNKTLLAPGTNSLTVYIRRVRG